MEGGNRVGVGGVEGEDEKDVMSGGRRGRNEKHDTGTLKYDAGFTKWFKNLAQWKLYNMINYITE